MVASEIQAAVIHEREQLALDLAGLTPDQWALPTDCSEWDVHDVLAHLVEVAKATSPRFLRDLVAAGFDFDRANAHGMLRERCETPAETLQEFRAVAHRTTGPPAPEATRLVEIIVHGEDLRRATGLTRDYPTEQVARALTYQVGASPAVGGSRALAAGLRLVATDAELTLGEGAEVHGTALSLLLALTGRSVEPDRLSGPGADRLRGPGLMPWSIPQLWSAAHAARASLADDLSRLEDDAWARPSLCGDWSVRDVVAHLTAAASTGRLAWLRSVVGARFDFDVHNQRRLVEHRGSSPAETLARFRSVVDSTTSASGHSAAWLGEVLVHAQDIRRPLGVASDPDIGALTQVARFFAGRDFTVPSHSTISGLRLEATDGPFAAGDPAAGDELVTGTTLALTMVMAGRTAYLEDLSGPGVPILRSRLSGDDGSRAS